MSVEPESSQRGEYDRPSLDALPGRNAKTDERRITTDPLRVFRVVEKDSTMKPIHLICLICSIAALFVSFYSGYATLSHTNSGETSYHSSREVRPGQAETETPKPKSRTIKGGGEANLKRRLSEMEKHLALLEKRLFGAESDQSSFATTLVQEDIARSPQELEAEMEALANEEEQRWNTRMEQIDSSFTKQLPDGDWSATMSETITRAFADEGVPAAQLLDVECRASMCRLQIARNTALDENRDFYLWLSAHVSKGFSAAVFQEDPGDKTQNGIVVYLVREGHELPRMQ